MRKFFALFGSAFSIIGSIVGAGFITGREIAAFFCVDLSVSGLYLTFLLFLFGVFSVCSFRGEKGVLVIGEKLAALMNVVIAGCMAAGLKSSYSNVLRHAENSEILSIISIIFAFIISVKGFRGIDVFSLAVMPVSLVLLSLMIFIKTDFSCAVAPPISPQGVGGVTFPALYAGLNIFLSLPVIVSAAENKTLKERLLLSIVVAATIVFLIGLISIAISSSNTLSSELPLVALFNGEHLFSFLMLIIASVGMLTTLICAFYSASTLVKGKFALPFKFLLILACFFVSRFGFSRIVGKIYPVLGALGAIEVISVSFSRVFFRSTRRERTFLPPKRKV